MHPLADTLPEPMGRRDFPAATNKNILTMKNSQTGQIINSLVCQYKTEVVQYMMVHSFKPFHFKRMQIELACQHVTARRSFRHRDYRKAGTNSSGVGSFRVNPCDDIPRMLQDPLLCRRNAVCGRFTRRIDCEERPYCSPHASGSDTLLYFYRYPIYLLSFRATTLTSSSLQFELSDRAPNSHRT